MYLTPRLKPPPLHTSSTALYQPQHLSLPPRPQRADQSIKHQHERHHGHHIRPKQQPPIAPEPPPTPRPQQRKHAQYSDYAAQIAALELEDCKAGGCREGVVQDARGQGVGKVVEGEGEEAEDLLVLLLRARHREQVLRGVGRVDGVRDVVQVLALIAGSHPFW